jgi:hypothetical protein
MLRLLTLCLAIAHCSAVRIAFIGNSYTYYNDLPNMVKELAANSDTPIEIAYAHELVGGSCLSNTCNGEVHQNRSATEALLRDPLGWDYVVLNDFSQAPARPDTTAISMDSLQNYYAPLIKAAGAVPVIYHFWAYRVVSVSGGLPSDDLGDFLEYSEKLNDGFAAYEAVMKAEISTTLRATTGFAWEQIYHDQVEQGTAKPEYDEDGVFYRLFFPDDRHPSITGTYLNACVIFSTIVGQRCSGNSYTRLLTEVPPISKQPYLFPLDYTTAELEYLQSVADSVVF